MPGFVRAFYLHSFIRRIHLFIAEINAMLIALHLYANRFICIFIYSHIYLLFAIISYLQLFIIRNY